MKRLTLLLSKDKLTADEKSELEVLLNDSNIKTDSNSFTLITDSDSGDNPITFYSPNLDGIIPKILKQNTKQFEAQEKSKEKASQYQKDKSKSKDEQPQSDEPNRSPLKPVIMVFTVLGGMAYLFHKFDLMGLLFSGNNKNVSIAEKETVTELRKTETTKGTTTEQKGSLLDG